MKNKYTLAALALATHAVHAAPVELQAALTTNIPTCAISVTPVVSTISASYKLEQADLDSNAPGAYDFPAPTAKFLVSMNDACQQFPKININLPAPVDRALRVDRQVVKHGVSWYTTSYLVDIEAFTSSNGTGIGRPVVGKVSGKANNTTGQTYNSTFTRTPPTWFTSYGTIDYTPSADAMVSTNLQSWANHVGLPVTANGAYSGYNVITPDVEANDASVLITVGSLFDKNGPRVGGAYDQRAAVNDLDYGWTDKVTVTVI